VDGCRGFAEEGMAADGDGDCESAAADGAAGVGVGVERGGAFPGGSVRERDAAGGASDAAGLDGEFEEPAGALSPRAARPAGEPRSRSNRERAPLIKLLELRIHPLLCANARVVGGCVMQRLSAEELGLLVALMREQVAHGLGEAAFRSYSSNVTSMSPALADLSLECVESAMQVSSIMKTFNAYNGPIPVPSFDAFVQAHKLLQRSLSEHSLHHPYKCFCRVRVWRPSFVGSWVEWR
jgi:hypothetical protein